MALPCFPNLAGTFPSRNVTFVSPHRDVGDGVIVISRRDDGGKPLSHFQAKRLVRRRFVGNSLSSRQYPSDGVEGPPT
jgi:hypothetical protein